MGASEPVPNVDDWAEVIGFYQETVHRYGWPFEPMLGLVQDLSQTIQGQALYPSTSHEHLGFSLVREYPQRVRMPQVWVSFLSRSGEFVVLWREHMGGPQEKIICQPDQVRPVVGSALTNLLARKSGASAV